MIKMLISLLTKKDYICWPHEYGEQQTTPTQRVKVRAWTPQGARMKAYDFLQAENIIVREYGKEKNI